MIEGTVKKDANISNKIATYDLERQPMSFDFATWLVLVMSLGFKGVSFYGDRFAMKRDLPVEIAECRFKNLVRPLCDLMGMKITQEVGGWFSKGDRISHMLKPLIEFFRIEKKIIGFPYEKRHNHICVTIRESFRNKHRNTNRKEIDRFVSWLVNRGESVVVIEDREQDPISVKERWDANCCKMNIMTSGGPFMLPALSGAPYLAFNFPGGEKEKIQLSKLHGIEVGDQLPWAKKNQRIVWEPDNFDVMVRNFCQIICYDIP